MQSMKHFLLVLLLAPSIAGAWTPPIGIPVPPWPSDLDIARPTLPNPWTSEQAGWYYIDPSGCSDSRTYGRPGASRCSLPSSPAVGSIIALNGTISGDKSIGFTGTSGAPIWIMGYNPESKPTISGGWEVTGGYVILDSLRFDRNSNDGNAGFTGHHLLVRDCLFRDPAGSSYGAGVYTTGSNIVFYHNTVLDQGDWQATSDVDRHGMKIAAGTADLWIVDNTLYHCQGDGVQVGDATNTAAQVNRVYLGRNTGYQNRQACMATKNATDVIFSENICYDFDYGEDSLGSAMAAQYDPKYVWFLGNQIYNSRSGIKMSSSSAGDGGPWYVIGNLIYDVSSPEMDCNNYNMGGIAYRNAGGITVLYNTLYNVDMFLAMPYGAGGTITVRNNIFSTKTGSCDALAVGPSFTHDYNLFTTSSYDPGSEPHRVVGDPKFVSPGTNFALQSGSLAIDAANVSEEAAFATFQSRYSIDIRKDLAGTTRPQNTTWDIGAYEYTAADPSAAGSTAWSSGSGSTSHAAGAGSLTWGP